MKLSAISRTLCRALFFCVLFLIPTTALFGQTLSATFECGTNTVDIGSILRQDSVTIPIQFTNGFPNKDSSGWNVLGSKSYFGLNDDSGNVSEGAIWNTSIHFIAPDSLGPQQITVTIKPNGDNGCADTLTLKAEVIGPTPNNTTFSIQHTSNPVIAFETSSTADSGTFYFRNDSSSTITIESIAETDSAAFSFSARGTPFQLAAHDSFPVGVKYLPSKIGSDNANLVVSAPDEPILVDVALQGVHTLNDKVELPAPLDAEIELYPNPTNGPLAVHTENISNAHVVVTDVLGRTEAESDVASDWNWNGEALGTPVSSGIYFVVITGIAPDGTPVRSVRNFIVNR